MKILSIFAILLGLQITHAQNKDESFYWLKVKTFNKEDRTKIANTGAAIEVIEDDYVVVLGKESEKKQFEKMGLLLQSFTYDFNIMDFPKEDEQFHNYAELLTELQTLAKENPGIVKYEVIGKSLEGRDIVNLRINGNQKYSSQMPAISFMGSHHAREHLSTEMPLMLAQYLVAEYKKGTPEIVRLVNYREINIIPLVNPDGAEYDIAQGRYRAWRKNRRPNGGYSYGVDLNRNYSYKWGTGGSSTNPNSETYMGPAPFSEPETQAVRNFISSKPNIPSTP